MSHPALVLLVRFRSPLSLDEIRAIAEARAPEFRRLPGLRQKYYLHDESSGEYGGLYLWDSPEDFAAYRESELRASIAEAYRAEGEPRVELLRVVMPLRDDRD